MPGLSLPFPSLSKFSKQVKERSSDRALQPQYDVRLLSSGFGSLVLGISLISSSLNLGSSLLDVKGIRRVEWSNMWETLGNLFIAAFSSNYRVCSPTSTAGAASVLLGQDISTIHVPLTGKNVDVSILDERCPIHRHYNHPQAFSVFSSRQRKAARQHDSFCRDQHDSFAKLPCYNVLSYINIRSSPGKNTQGSHGSPGLSDCKASHVCNGGKTIVL